MLRRWTKCSLLGCTEALKIMTIKRPIPKFIALVLISLVVSFLAMSADRLILVKLDSMSATEYVDYQRKAFQHSFFHHYVVWLVLGGCYLAMVEFVAYVIGLFFKKPAS